MKLNTFILSLCFLAGTSLLMFSCKKPESPTATVKVLNRLDDNKPVANALVTVYVDVPMGKVEPTFDGKETRIARTNNSGVVKFDFESVNIFNVKAEIAVNNGDTLYGIGVLRLKEDQDCKETVYLSQYKSQI